MKYPINLVGFEGGADSGDVVTHEGEYLGTWRFDGCEEFEQHEFIPDGETEPIFSDHFIGLLCRRIAEWHENGQ